LKAGYIDLLKAGFEKAKWVRRLAQRPLTVLCSSETSSLLQYGTKPYWFIRGCDL